MGVDLPSWHQPLMVMGGEEAGVLRGWQVRAVVGRLTVILTGTGAARV